MDWFVDRRVEERQKWDPKALLDQVLGQIFGTDCIGQPEAIECIPILIHYDFFYHTCEYLGSTVGQSTLQTGDPECLKSRGVYVPRSAGVR